MMKPITKLLPLTIVCVLYSSAAWAGGGPGPFELELRASAGVTGDFQTVQTGASVADEPVTNQASDANGLAQSLARFTELGAFGDYSPPTTFATAAASANDQITITAPTAPAGTTRLDMVWQLTGTLAGNGNVNFTIGDPGGSFFLTADYSLNTTDNLGDPTLDAGFFQFLDPGPFDQSLTMVLDGIPIGAPFNVETRFFVIADGLNSTSDFSNFATLASVSLFVDDVLTPAAVTGASGQVYSVIPEPASLVLLGVCGLVLLGVRQGRKRLFAI